MTVRRGRAVVGGIVGPVAFVGTWLIAGLVKTRYSALHDPISELAAVHASTRSAMTSAFVVFGVGMSAYGWSLRYTVLGPARLAAAVSGLATLGVAAFPLHHSAAVDHLHGMCADTGYVTLASTALIGAACLYRAGHRRWAGLAAATGIVCAVSLALTPVGSFGGLFQRTGLTAGDVWVVSSAIALRRGSWDQVPA